MPKDINEYMLKEMSRSFGPVQGKILGVYAEDLFAYLTLEVVNSKGVFYLLDKIAKETAVEKIVVSEQVNDVQQEKLVEYLSKKQFKFAFTTKYEEKSRAALAVVAVEKGEVGPDGPYDGKIPYVYLKHYGETLCGDCYEKLSRIDARIVHNYKEQTFFNREKCTVCQDRKGGK